MRYLWNMLNKEFTIEGAVSAFLVINMIGWMAATMGAGMLICKFLGFSITGNLENLMCAGIYGGLIVGLVGGQLISVRVIQTPLHGIEDKLKRDLFYKTV